MDICYKCGLREAKVGGLCKQCSKGLPWEDDEKPSFEEFSEQHLKGVPDVQAIYRADDVLLQYAYYKSTDGMFEPALRYGSTGYREEHSKLEKWFSTCFFKVLRDRVFTIDSSALNEGNYGTIEREFSKFMSRLNEILLDMTFSRNEQKYIGTADITPTLIFFKKVIRGLGIVPDCVDVAGNVFVPGSAMFFLELYALLKDEDILLDLQNKVSVMRENDARELVRIPMVLLKPWDHQSEAFEAWERNSFNGIMEMATATGKTLLGFMAIEKISQTKNNATVRIFTHSRAILNQWRREAIDKLGLISNVESDYRKPIYCNGLKIHFNTLQTVYKRPEDFPADLLIVDEVHHVAAFEFRKALSINCNWKMGLSATIEGEERTNILKRELGPIVYRFSLKEALEKGVLPKFKWKLHTVYLSVEEEEEFGKISRRISKLFRRISDDAETIKKISDGRRDSIEDLYEFIKLIGKARYKGIELPEHWRTLQALVLQRRWIIHRCKPKLEHAIKLAKHLALQNKVIVFAMDIDSCNLIANELEQDGVNVFLVHSDIDEDANRRIIDFKKASHGALVGARMLEEGIDIPDAEIGINVSSSKTRLQLVQRMGRILRMKKGKKPLFHHYIALPGSEFYLHEEDNLTFLDDLSWVQDTALKMGVHAELEKEEISFERLRLDAEEMIRRRYLERKIPTLPRYGTFRLENILNLFSSDAKNEIVFLLSRLDPEHRISDVEWSEIVRKAHKKKVDDPLNIPGYWWILVIGDRTPSKIKDIFKNHLKGYSM